VIEIISKVKPGLVLHRVFDIDELNSQRLDISEPNQFLQVAALKLTKGKKFRAHKHIPCYKEHTTTQESWVVLSGRVKAFYYDLDDTLISEVILDAGSVSITYAGGHNYECLVDALVYEFKTGPYEGVEKDKVFVNE
jgi:hypothetical protein